MEVCEKKDEDDEEDDPNYLSKLTVVVLKAKLKARDLTISGYKPVIVVRLRSYIKNVEGCGEENNLEVIRNKEDFFDEELV